jgi:hypothetical protein
MTMKRVVNKDRKSGANSHYWLVETDAGPLLFTDHQIRVAWERAQKNPEDVLDLDPDPQAWLDRLKDLLG